MENEIWKINPEFPDYEMSNLGRCRKNNKIISTRKCIGNHDKYYTRILIDLRKDKKRYTRVLARQLAITFLGNFPDLEVDHIDDNPLNNNINNLRWISHKENMNKETYKKNINTRSYYGE